MKILHLTDLHLTDGRDLDLQTEVILRVIEEFEGESTDHDRMIIVTGDIYGVSVPHRSTPKERASAFQIVETAATLGPVVVIYGNHDYPGDLDTFEYISGDISVISSADVSELCFDSINIKLFSLPWPTKANIIGAQRGMGSSESRDLAESKLNELVDSWRYIIDHKKSLGFATVFAAHITVAGSLLDNGTVIRTGDMTVSSEILNRMNPDAGLLGHAHTWQAPVKLRENIVYGGSPFPITFGEAGDRFYNVFELTRSGGETVTQVTKRKIRSPLKLTLDWRWGYLDDGAIGWISRPSDDDIAACTGNIVKTRLSSPKNLKSSVPWSDELSRFSGVLYITEKHDVETSQRVRAPEIAESNNLEDKIEAYFKTKDIAKDSSGVISALNEIETMTLDDIDEKTLGMV